MKLPQKIFFSGIGGIGMSGLAKILVSRGYKISGSDLIENEIIRKLKETGVRFCLGQKAQNLKDAEMLVVSAAIKNDNPEIIEAKTKNIPIITRSKLLGILMSEKKGIAVAGTHGKTTTSTMLSLILEKAGLDPAIAVGGEVKNIGGNAKDGKGEYFVAESCEYERSFLDLHPHAAIITNIEAEHLDTYGDLSHILESFSQFLSQVDLAGFVVISAWDANLKKVISSYKGKVISYGFHEGDWRAENIKICDHKTDFDVFENKKKLGSIELVIPGAHNILNVLAVTAAASEIGIKFDVIKKVLSDFHGAKRRFEIKGHENGILVIDDYAHHPTEIQATLDGLRSYYPENRVWCVFQAHQYSRTRFLMQDFAKSFSKVDQVLVSEIYEVRDNEEDKKVVSGKILAKEINKISHNAQFISNFDEIVEYLKKNVKPGDIVITIGAGNVYQTGERLLTSLKQLTISKK